MNQQFDNDVTDSNTATNYNGSGPAVQFSLGSIGDKFNNRINDDIVFCNVNTDKERAKFHVTVAETEQVNSSSYGGHTCYLARRGKNSFVQYLPSLIL